MSEISQHKEQRVSGLLKLFRAILEKKDPVGAVKRSETLISQTLPSDIIAVVDELVREKIPMEELKTGINKFLNVLHKAIKSRPAPEITPGSLVDCCFRNNTLLDEKLKALRPDIKKLNAQPDAPDLHRSIQGSLEELLQFERYYVIKENILFPLLENHWPDFRCLGVMWSFHDDIRRDLRNLNLMVQSGKFEIMDFNRLIGNTYFNMYAIRFREEAILFPHALETISERELNALLPECLELGFPYYNPPLSSSAPSEAGSGSTGEIDLLTGMLAPEQIKLIFNHLPVDITYVDEHNKVRYFSSPKKRIFPRSKAVIGRDVRNCHPPESVHVVEEIVDAFRAGKKDEASFWIRIKGELLLIRYFAVRDESGTYKGVIEVSQEVSVIQALEGERRLLDW